MESLIWKREEEVSDSLERREEEVGNSILESMKAEDFTGHVVEATSRILISYTGWQEVSDEFTRYTAASQIFRL